MHWFNTIKRINVNFWKLYGNIFRKRLQKLSRNKHNFVTQQITSAQKIFTIIWKQISAVPLQVQHKIQKDMQDA